MPQSGARSRLRLADGVVSVKGGSARATPLRFLDKNAVQHECPGEALDTAYNVSLFIYPVDALTSTSIPLPASRGAVANRKSGYLLFRCWILSTASSVVHEPPYVEPRIL